VSEDRHARVESIDDLVAFLRSGEKPAERFRVGTEHEKIGLYEDTHDRVPFEGERGIGRLLDDIARADDWKRIFEGDNVIALEKDGASITLEPGGQLELSGAPLRTIHETCDEFHTHLALMKRVCEPLGIVFVGLGIDPIHSVDRVPVMPKSRYRIMREYLPTRGSRPLEMMFVTATVQANFDYSSEADMVSKVRTAVGVSPIVSAIYANSSLYLGKDSGFASRRLEAWFDTDPDRCGMLPWIFDEGFGYERYVEWALDVPMFFVVRDGTYHFAKGTTFRQFLARGFEGYRANLDDWDRHLTTLFPDVRIKRYIEVRCADAVPPGLTCSLPALWKGILYDAEALASAWSLVSDLQIEEREAARVEVAKRGLAAQVSSQPVLELARALVEISREGLARIADGGSKDSDECGFLDPVFEQLESGKSPGEAVAELWEAEWGRSVDRLIDYARY
jgi:glutamate--cysteine ligase